MMAAMACVAVNTVSLTGFLVFPVEGPYARFYALFSVMPYSIAGWVIVSAALNRVVEGQSKVWKPEPLLLWSLPIVFVYKCWILATKTSWFTSGPADYAGPLCAIAISLGFFSAMAYMTAVASETPRVKGSAAVE